MLQTQADPIISHIKSGGAFVDTDGFNATIQSPMHDDGGPGNFTKQGEGSLTLSGASSFTGDITITAGELITSLQRNVANPTTSALGNLTVEGRTVTVESGATLTFGNVNDSLGSFQYKTPVTMVADGGTIQNGSGRFLSIGDIVLRNGGVFNTQNGAADGFQAFNLRGSITVEGTSGASITTTGTLRTGIHLGGTTIAPTTFDVAATGDPTADLIVSVPLLDEVNEATGGLIKAGDGRMVLAAANTYSGDTVVAAGVLVVNGSLGATETTVESGAALAGSGSLGGPVNVLGGGALLPGNSIGSLTVGNLSMAAGSTYVFEAQDASATGADLLVAGTLALAGVSLDLTGANLDAANWNLGDRLTLISYTGDALTSGFTGFDDDTTYLFGANEWLFRYADDTAGNNFSAQATGDQFVTMTMIPEPGAAVLALMAAGLALLRRRR